jgi:UDP-glucose 4-epimerase
MSTLVFGGAGFVGLNVAENLLSRGKAVVICDLTLPPAEALSHFDSLPGNLRIVTGDVLDQETLREAFDGPIDSVIFGAAITGGADRDAAEPERILEVNLLSFVSVLRLSRASRVRRVINLSSAGAYGDAAFADTPLDEQTTCADPTSIYSLTKFGTERVGARLGGLWNIDVRSVRLSAVFGRWERVTSVRDTQSPHFQAMELAFTGKPALFDRAGFRDWTYGPDIAAAVTSLAEADQLNYSLYNISCGSVSSALEWAQALALRVDGFEVRLCHDGEKPTISLHSTTDRQPLVVERLTEDIGFRADFDLPKSVADYLGWSRNSSPPSRT